MNDKTVVETIQKEMELRVRLRVDLRPLLAVGVIDDAKDDGWPEFENHVLRTVQRFLQKQAYIIEASVANGEFEDFYLHDLVDRARHGEGPPAADISQKSDAATSNTPEEPTF